VRHAPTRSYGAQMQTLPLPGTLRLLGENSPQQRQPNSLNGLGESRFSYRHKKRPVNELAFFRNLERETRFELATPTLARLCSTTELFPRGVPKGIRTPVTAVKGRCPRPLDDGDLDLTDFALLRVRQKWGAFY
jgi:hypothetical protein